ncbi:uncharacterized protein BT62DRAFT_767596 [Guyanagaster necrorhizus]|uniref:Uncharacterized protein n=1 Tax=Guyanagaster necrorhizus TaxID=856835 RepID=A0A9P7VYW4_9AGAR|nr:uncharacterized protein BT62DRAFT_767596 [Guyanagaster necrorhizus MCA 3950]KAG7448361.1 hypothetical protein BT62DRAFT_767596 [Guyanagaster necrorhizus MCA 3950]
MIWQADTRMFGQRRVIGSLFFKGANETNIWAPQGDSEPEYPGNRRSVPQGNRVSLSSATRLRVKIKRHTMDSSVIHETRMRFSRPHVIAIVDVGRYCSSTNQQRIPYILEPQKSIHPYRTISYHEA